MISNRLIVSVLASLSLVGSAFAQTKPTAGSTGAFAINSAFSEIANNLAAQAAARVNLGLGSLATLNTLNGLDAGSTNVTATNPNGSTNLSTYLSNLQATANTAVQPGGPVDTNLVAGRTLGAIAGDVFNIKAATYGAKGDGSTDDSAALTSVLSAIQNSASGGSLYLPCGDYVFSTNFAANVGANQRLTIRTEGPSCVRLHFTNANAAGIAVTLQPVTNATWISNGPSFSADNLVFVSDWSTTVSQAALSVTFAPGQTATTPNTYVRPLPPGVAISHITALSKTNSGDFLNAVVLNGVNIAHLEDVWMRASPGDTTASAVSMSAPSVATGILFNRLRQQNGGTALTITDSYQGIYVSDMQTVGTQHSISWTNPGGYTGADNLIVTKSQLNSVGTEVVTNGVAHVEIVGNYCLGGGSGWGCADLTGGSDHVIASNDIVSTTASDTASIGVKLTNVAGAALTGNAICGPVGTTTSGAPIVLAGSTARVHGAGNTLCAGTVLGVDGSSAPNNNGLTSSRIGNLMIPYGWSGGDKVVNLGPSAGGTNPNSINAGSTYDVVAGTINIINSGCTGSVISGFNNTCNAAETSAVGRTNDMEASDSQSVGKAGFSPYIGCAIEANNPNSGIKGAAQHMICTGQVQATGPSTAVRATLDGTTTVANYNVFGLNSFGGQTTAAMEITVAGASTTAASGTWKMPLGELDYKPSASPTTVWTAGTPQALGAAFGVGITADTSTGAPNIQITNPSGLASSDRMTYTVTIRAVIVRPY